GVPARIGDVDAARRHACRRYGNRGTRPGPTASLGPTELLESEQGPRMSSPIDTEGEARHHADTGCGQVPAHFERHRAAVRGGPPRPDDGHAGPPQVGKRPTPEQHPRRLRIVEEHDRVARMAYPGDPDPARRVPRPP